jgi:hypothetical protein
VAHALRSGTTKAAQAKASSVSTMASNGSGASSPAVTAATTGTTARSDSLGAGAGATSRRGPWGT